MDKEALDLLLENIAQLETLTPAQLATILAAVEAYDPPAGSFGESWRTFFLNTKDGKFGDAGRGSFTIRSGELTIQACS